MCVIEKLAGRTESPQTVSECSGSHDDSGHVSGGSQGTTPEHKRTDSNYSASSIPSTLSTVTDVAILARFALLLLITQTKFVTWDMLEFHCQLLVSFALVCVHLRKDSYFCAIHAV